MGETVSVQIVSLLHHFLEERETERGGKRERGGGGGGGGGYERYECVGVCLGLCLP